MKTTINKIQKGFDFLKQSNIEKIEGKTKELEASFIMEQVKSFNVDLSNKTAVNTIATDQIGVAFQLSTKEDFNKKTSSLDLEKDADMINYLREVTNIANRTVNGCSAPLNKALQEVKKSLLTNDLATFNEYMKIMFDVELSKELFARLQDMLMFGKVGTIAALSNNQFKNLFMELMTARLVASGSYSPKRTKGALNKAIKEVPTISYEDALKLDTTVVDNCIDMLGLSSKYAGSNYNYAEMKERVIKALHTKIAVEPPVKED